MNKHGHQLSAATLALAVVPATLGTPTLVGVTLVAVATSHGWLSPDVDQRVRWLTHRTTTHTLEYVVVASAVLVALATHYGIGWVGWGVALGWLSHLLVDALFGGIPSVLLGGSKVVRRRSLYKGTIRSRNRITTRRIGTHLKTGGPAELAAYGILPVMILGLIVARILGTYAP